jgi:hypothetical protein
MIKFSKLILLASPAKPFSLSGKGAPQRTVVIEQYSQEIDEVYEALEENSSLDIHLPDSWDKRDIRRFVDELLSTTLDVTVGSKDDIFHAGCSRLAISLRHILVRS